MNGKTENGQTIRHISDIDRQHIVDSLCAKFTNPRWAWESEIKTVEKNHIDELVKQSRRKRASEKSNIFKQDCIPGNWKKESVPEYVLRSGSRTVNSWQSVRDSLKGRKTTLVDLAFSMNDSLNERMSWKCPTNLSNMRSFLNDCPAYRRMQGFFVDICLIFRRSDITWNALSYRLELLLVAVFQILADCHEEDLQKAVSFAVERLKYRPTINEFFSNISNSSWRGKNPDVLIPSWMWLMSRCEGIDIKNIEKFHVDGIASEVFLQMWPRLNKRNTSIFDLMLCSVFVWYLLPFYPGTKGQMGVVILETILDQSCNVHLDSSLQNLQQSISQKITQLNTEAFTLSSNFSSGE